MNKRNRFRAGLSFGIAMAVFFILQTLLVNDKQATNQTIKSIALGLVAGAISGVLFGWLMGLFAKSKFVTQTTKIETDPDEHILFETPANHFKGAGSVGGHLCLTDKRLRFKSQGINTQSEECTINLSDISHVNTFKTLGLVNNGIEIITNEQVVERFVVDKQKHWLQSIDQIKRHTTMGFAQVGQTE